MFNERDRYTPHNATTGTPRPIANPPAAMEAELYGRPGQGPRTPRAGRYQPAVFGQRPEQEIVRVVPPAHLQDRWNRIIQRLRLLRRSQSVAAAAVAGSIGTEYDSYGRVKGAVEDLMSLAWEGEIAVMEVRLHLVDSVADVICAPQEEARDQELRASRVTQPTERRRRAP